MDISLKIIEKYHNTKKMFGIKKAEFPIDEVIFKKKISKDKEHHWGEEAHQNEPKSKTPEPRVKGIGTLSKSDVEFIDVLNNIISKNSNVKKSDILIEIKRTENLKGIKKERAVELTNYFFEKKK